MTVLILAISELWVARHGEALARLQQGRGDDLPIALVIGAPTAGRLLAAIVLTISRTSFDARSWAVIVLMVTATTSLAVTVYVFRIHGRPARPHLDVRRLIEGLPYVSGAAAKSVYTSSDRVVLDRMRGAATAGNYAAAYPAIELVAAYTRGRLQAKFGRLNLLATTDPQAAWTMSRANARRCLLVTVPLALLATILAPLTVAVLGEGYERVVPMIRVLVWTAAFQAMSGWSGDLLTALDAQATRAAVQGGVAALNVVLTVALVSMVGWPGAAGATLLSEALLAALLRLGVRRHYRTLAHPS